MCPFLKIEENKYICEPLNRMCLFCLAGNGRRYKIIREELLRNGCVTNSDRIM